MLHGANSFIQYFNLLANRQRRIGGVATTSRSTKNRWNPHYIYTLLPVRFSLFLFLWFCPRDGIRFFVFYLFGFNTFFGVYNLTNFHLSSITSVWFSPWSTKFWIKNQICFKHGFAKIFSFLTAQKNLFSICRIQFR